MMVLLEASFTLNSVFPEVSHGFPWQCLLGLICFICPVLGFFFQVLFGKHLPRQGDWLPVSAMFCSFLCAVGICALHLTRYDPNYAVEWRWNWMEVEGDGHGVKHSPEMLAKLHLGDAFTASGLTDARGKLARLDAKIPAAEAALKKVEGEKVALANENATLEAGRKQANDKSEREAISREINALALKIEANEAAIAAATADVARLKAWEPRWEELKAKPEVFLFSGALFAYEVDENATEMSQRERRQAMLNWLHDADGKKKAENHARFNAWISGNGADAKFAREVLGWYASQSNPSARFVNERDTLKESFAIGIYIDNTTAITLFMVTLLSFLIHLFSTGYMKGEVRYSRFFANINLFTLGMIGLVLANSFLWLFVSWEIMGLCSYLLIGHYYEKPSAQAACIKAFITTRIGDCFMFVGMMLAFLHTHSLLFSGPTEFQSMFAGWQEGALDGMFRWGLTTYGGPGSMFAGLGAQAALIGGGVLTAIGILMFIGPVGKSAQFPLHVWLPDAMEGPTPVSAMIHAACMVSAGVYLTARLFPLFTPDALHVIAFTGGFTALFAGTIGLMQTDIKKVLAYSTISQLGYMFLGIGVGAWVPAVFHMITHAFFKALMFLGSGSVILGCSHEQEMTRMGGLWKKMPITAATFWIGNLAITGAPFFFSGFYSKEAVLTQAKIFGADSGFVMMIPYLFGALGAGLTTFYMFRLVWMTFHGKPRDQWVYDHCKESPWNVVLPLIIIAGFAACVGWPLAAHTNLAENLGFTNVVEFGVLTWFTIVLVLMCALYLFRRRNEPNNAPLLRLSAYSVVIGFPSFLLLYVIASYAGYAGHTVDAGPHEEVAEILDQQKEFKGLRQYDGSRALEAELERAMLKEITERATKKEQSLSAEEIEKTRQDYDKKLAQALRAEGKPAAVGRPDAAGQSWFNYLVQKPRSAFSRQFLVDNARFDQKYVDLLYKNGEGRAHLADSPGMMPSAQWAGRYHDWRVRQGLLEDPAFTQSEKQARDHVRDEHAAELAAAIKKANAPAPHADHGHGHENGHHPEDPVVAQWHEIHHAAHLQVFGGSMVAFLIGLALSMFFFSPWGPFYRRDWVGHVGFMASTRSFLKRGYLLDDLYYGTVIRAQGYIMRACAWFDKFIIDGFVNLCGTVTVWLGWLIAKIDYWGVDGTVRAIHNGTGWAASTASKAPTGKISDYVFMLIGTLVLVFILLALLS